MKLEDVMKALYESEINCSILSFWDDGWTVTLGDGLNGFVAVGNFRTLEECASFLDRETRRHFPESDYTRRNGGPLPVESASHARIESTDVLCTKCGQINHIEGFSDVFAFRCCHCGQGNRIVAQ